MNPLPRFATKPKPADLKAYAQNLHGARWFTRKHSNEPRKGYAPDLMIGGYSETDETFRARIKAGPPRGT